MVVVVLGNAWRFGKALSRCGNAPENRRQPVGQPFPTGQVEK